MSWTLSWLLEYLMVLIWEVDWCNFALTSMMVIVVRLKRHIIEFLFQALFTANTDLLRFRVTCPGASRCNHGAREGCRLILVLDGEVLFTITNYVLELGIYLLLDSTQLHFLLILHILVVCN